ncbi:hypothetical protein [Methyloversatilis sp. RAC08]|uniref:hypothetical protein n=1 Tax=Methyloversatilis sp. RAC08 TaxID=1842540 RepID=UPI0012375DFF|nr:hypothetical protein [Methyloversatilis sp. RAC08]
MLRFRLAVEHFSGELRDAIRQDFSAKVWLSNLVASFAYLARSCQPEPARERFTPNLSYAMTTVGAALPRLLRCLARPGATLRQLLKLISSALEAPRPDRSFPRNRQPVKPARLRAYKPV